MIAVFIFYIWRMRSKWYIGTFIVFLSLLTSLVQQQLVVHNQEVVLQFNEIEASSAHAKETIAVITERLHKLGAEDVKIVEKGELITISYYSDDDVASIKKQLLLNTIHLVSDAEENESDPSTLPIKNPEKAFNLDVFEIQQDKESNRGLEGTTVMEFDPVSDRPLKPEYFAHSGATHLNLDSELTAIALKINGQVILNIDDPLFIIPEVRAGPFV